MIKPVWDDAPEWAKYLAMDTNGEYWWHERKPIFDGNDWIGTGKISLAVFAESAIHSLERRPKVKK